MILVTGAGGFLGRILVRLLSDSGLEVMPFYHSRNCLLTGDSWSGDLTDEAHIRLMKEASPRPVAVVHLAGLIDIALDPNPFQSSSRPLPGKQNISAIYAKNVLTSAHVLEYCLDAGVTHLIFASSQAVYGFPHTRPLKESSPLAPIEHYAASKACCELLLKTSVSESFAVTALRFPGLYGLSRKSGVVYDYCLSALRQKMIQIDATFPIPLDVIYVDDVANAFLLSIQHGGNGWLCMNIATGDPCSLNVLADEVAHLVLGCVVNQCKIPQPIVQMDPSLARRELGWRAVPRRDRLLQMIESIKNDQ